jgi:hypothetical protein
MIPKEAVRQALKVADFISDNWEELVELPPEEVIEILDRELEEQIEWLRERDERNSEQES